MHRDEIRDKQMFRVVCNELGAKHRRQDVPFKPGDYVLYLAGTDKLGLWMFPKGYMEALIYKRAVGNNQGYHALALNDLEPIPPHIPKPGEKFFVVSNSAGGPNPADGTKLAVYGDIIEASEVSSDGRTIYYKVGNDRFHVTAYEMVFIPPPPAEDNCTCPIDKLVNYGCSCGHLDRLRAAALPVAAPYIPNWGWDV